MTIHLAIDGGSVESYLRTLWPEPSVIEGDLTIFANPSKAAKGSVRWTALEDAVTSITKLHPSQNIYTTALPRCHSNSPRSVADGAAGAFCFVRKRSCPAGIWGDEARQLTRRNVK
jgi:hypothetical protein